MFGEQLSEETIEALSKVTSLDREKDQYNKRKYS